MKLLKSSPPIFELQIDRDGTPTVVKVKALFWHEYDKDARQDKLQTSIRLFSTYKNFEQWLHCFEFEQLDEWTVVTHKLMGNEEGLVSRKSLLAFCGIKGSTLNYRIENMGHPKPIVNGRKHWFRADDCDKWIADQDA